MDRCYYEIIHNLVFEMTRTGIEVKNLKMRVESLSSRLEFNERRARALESVVVYKPAGDDRATQVGRAPRPPPAAAAGADSASRRRPPSSRPCRASRAAQRAPAEGPASAAAGGAGGADDAAAPPAAPSWAAPRRPGRRRRRDRIRRRGAGQELLEPATQAVGSGGSDIRAITGPNRRRWRGSTTESGHRPDAAVKLAVVVQRYGQAINGGAELHARYIAEHLARHAEVEVLTTCATDYVTWRNELPPGVEQVNGVPVRRFRVKHERDPAAVRPAIRTRVRTAAFDRRRARLARRRRSDQPGARRAHRQARGRLRLLSVLQLSLLPRVPRRARRRARAPFWCRPPSATRRSAWRCSAAVPRRARGHVQLARRAGDDPGRRPATTSVPGVVVGIGSDVPQNPQPARFRQKYDIRGPFAVYVGRIDENKGCKELFEFFQGYLRRSARASCRWC